MAHHHEGHDHTIRVLHVTAPTCWWSWGYLGAMNRIRLVYGDQVRVETAVGCVWTDFEQYLKDYEMTEADLEPEARAAIETMGVALATEYRREAMPGDMLPASLGAMAALRQGPEAQERWLRAVLWRWNLELRDVTRRKEQLDAAREARLDVERFARDLDDTDGLVADLEGQAPGWPHLPLGYYNVAVTDGHRHVLLDHAFEPEAIESAIDWLSGGGLRKARPTDVAGYVRENGLVPLAEVARVFALPPREAEERLDALVKEGRLERERHAGAPHWRAAEGSE